MKTWLYHKTNPAKIFDNDIDDMAKLHEDGWRDSPVMANDVSDNPPTKGKGSKTDETPAK